MKKFVLVLLIALSIPAFADNCANLPAPATLPPNGKEVTPQMGWDGWYTYGVNATEAEIKTQSDLLVSLGLKSLGYHLVQIDDGWPAASRVSGQLVADATKFPDGMASLFTYIHNDGLLAGIYSSPNTTTCGGYLGSGTFEATDATTFVSWGADALKYDGCGVSALYTSCWATKGPQVWQMMAQDVTAAGGSMILSVGTVNTLGDPWWNSFTWEQNAGWNEIAIPKADINGSWPTFDSYMDAAAGYSTFVGSGFWIGFGYLQGHSGSWSDTQMQTQFALEALWNSPLVLGMNLSSLTAPELDIYKNTSIISIDQDSLGKMATRFADGICGSSFCDGWSKPLSGGRAAIGLVNRDTSTHTMHVSLGGYYQATDDWTGANLGVIAEYTATLQPYQSDILTLTPASPQAGMVNMGAVNVAVVQ